VEPVVRHGDPARRATVWDLPEGTGGGIRAM